MFALFLLCQKKKKTKTRRIAILSPGHRSGWEECTKLAIISTHGFQRNTLPTLNFYKKVSKKILFGLHFSDIVLFKLDSVSTSYIHLVLMSAGEFLTIDGFSCHVRIPFLTAVKNLKFLYIRKDNYLRLKI
nr:uncharacterized protein LOC122272481 [Parasteatoda tepidariorum]